MHKLGTHETQVLSTKIYHHTTFSTLYICKNHNFIPALNDGTFQMWNNKGPTFNKLYTDGHFISRFGLFHSRFHHYLQIRHYAFSDYRIQQVEHCFYYLVWHAQGIWFHNLFPCSRHS